MKPAIEAPPGRTEANKAEHAAHNVRLVLLNCADALAARKHPESFGTTTTQKYLRGDKGDKHGTWQPRCARCNYFQKFALGVQDRANKKKGKKERKKSHESNPSKITHPEESDCTRHPGRRTGSRQEHTSTAANKDTFLNLQR